MSQAYAPVKHEQPSHEAGSPVLTDADEEFLRRLASDDQGAEEPEREVLIGKDGKAIGSEGPEKVPLPASPAPEGGSTGRSKPPPAVKTSRTEDFKNKGREYLAFAQSRLPFGKNATKRDAGGKVQDVATAVKTGEPPEAVAGAKKEESDMANILTKLNLSAVNNKAFAFSKESQKLFDRFTQVLKDIINGVPTAYNDLEKLLTDSDKQLREMYEKMPQFLQNLIKTLPSKMTATVAPALAAAMSEKPGNDGKLHAPSNQRRSAMPRLKIPALKSLVKGDAVIAMLRSILQFLKLRFPAALAGTNVLLSLAVFLLLFVFWYCHKRGREVRLEKEAATAAEGQKTLKEEESDVEASENNASDDEEERAILEAALKRRPPHQVASPAVTKSEQNLK